jgi:hypothetical protein
VCLTHRSNVETNAETDSTLPCDGLCTVKSVERLNEPSLGDCLGRQRAMAMYIVDGWDAGFVLVSTKSPIPFTFSSLCSHLAILSAGACSAEPVTSRRVATETRPIRSRYCLPSHHCCPVRGEDCRTTGPVVHLVKLETGSFVIGPSKKPIHAPACQ